MITVYVHRKYLNISQFVIHSTFSISQIYTMLQRRRMGHIHSQRFD